MEAVQERQGRGYRPHAVVVSPKSGEISGETLSEPILSINFPGDPIAHARPRMGRGGRFYTPEKTRTYRQNLANAIIAEMTGSPYQKGAHDTYALNAVFYRSTRQRIDIDNLIKTVFDAVTQTGFWADDCRVHEVSARIEKASENPRVEFSISLLEDRGPKNINKKYQFMEHKLCPQCGQPMDREKTRSYPSSIRKYCSLECFSKSRRQTLTCAYCFQAFDLPKSLTRKNGLKYPRKFCSRTCSIEYHRLLKRIKGKESDKWVCLKCGGRVSRKEYKVCRACSMTTRSDPSSNYWKLRHPHVEIKITAPGEEE